MNASGRDPQDYALGVRQGSGWQWRPLAGELPGERAAEADRPLTAGTWPGGDALDRLNQRLSMAGLRLLRLRRRLDRPGDRLMLLQASEDLDEAIAEIRRLALASRIAPEGR